MVTAGQQMTYRCSQCGSPEIVALSLLYEQGTRSFSGRFTSGVSQSYIAKVASPPAPRSYLRAFLGWGFTIFFCVFWGSAGFRAIIQHPEKAESLGDAVTFLSFLAFMFFLGMLFNFRKIAHYNREVYPRLYSDWAQTFMCRRCGKYSLIRS
jgi:predicted RNA-binding Zn-ribbon protein involved in translation (DUF1610 family)